MEKVRVLNKPEDFKRLGLNPNVVEQWEDGRRREPAIGLMENWYFDTILDDGTKVVVVFLTKSMETRQLVEDSPNVRIQITTPDGRQIESHLSVTAAESEIRKGECHVQFGPHSFVGNLVHYDIIVNPIEGVGCNLHLHVLVKPFRPGAGYVAFGDDEAKEYTWLCFPRGEVTGTLTYEGQTRQVHGMGYHDHQFHNVDSMSIIHHWLWGRQSLEDYTVVIFDIVANEKYGFRRVPIFGLIDNKTGDVIFENDGVAECEIEELDFDEKSKKRYPAAIKYTYAHGDTRVEYTIRQKQHLEIRAAADIVPEYDEKAKAKLDAAGLDPAYLRYLASAELVFTKGDTVKKASGDMIYEFAYFGKYDERAGVELGPN